MQDAGFIKVFRKLTEWEWYKDGATKDVFLHLLLTANYKPSRYKGYEIGVGSVVIGRKQLAEDLGLSERQIRTALEHLKTTSELTIKTTNRFSVATLTKYADYQVYEKDSDQQIDQQNANKRPTSDQQATTSKEYKESNNKRIKEIYKGISCPDVVAALDEFVAMRKLIKKPMTDKAIERLINKLVGMTEDDETRVAILKQSVDACWRDIYPLKKDTPHTEQSRYQDATEEWYK